jgi:hypothetical protein
MASKQFYVLDMAVGPHWIAAIRRFDRSPSSCIALASLAPVRGQAATGCRRYTSPRAIIAQITGDLVGQSDRRDFPRPALQQLQ